jgi:hypothetical protein
LKQSLSFSTEHRYKVAGGLAAETLKNNPQLMTSQFCDPVPVWQEIRDFVFSRITQGSNMRSFPNQMIRA